MSVKIKPKIISAVIIIASVAFLAFSSSDSNKKGRLSKTENTKDGPSAYIIKVNKLHFPLNDEGVIANVTIGGQTEGEYDDKGLLYSGGFMISGKNGGLLWSSAVATSSRIQDYVPGTAGMDQNDPKAHLYIVKSSDPPFGQSWQDWKDAVSMGAYFYDGDHDGVYNPVDKNGNGQWDPDEDMPDLLGDETVWCVYNDGLPRAQRAFSDQDPAGIEIRQTIWGYATSGDLGNILFVRYSFQNAGTVADRYDSVYFSVWDDVDIGGDNGYGDDLIGCDTTLNAGYTYNDGPDPTYGVDPPCFLCDFFQGPLIYTGNPDDQAYNTKGPLLGIDTIPGAVNGPLTSFVHYEQGKDPNTAQQQRNLLLGLTRDGAPNDPCATPDLGDEFGTVLGGVDCSTIPPQFMYSGDPVTQIGWINNYPTDQRQMLNTGPFVLEKGKPVDVIAAYVVGRSTSALASVVKAKSLDRSAQFVFDNNFNFPSPPPAVTPQIVTTDNSIQLIWDTKPQVTYRKVGRGYDMIFESYDVYMHQTNSLAAQEGGLTNTKLIASYDVANDISKMIYEDPVNLERTIVYDGGTQLDSATYASDATGRISLTITTDPFTSGPLIKGKPYFISITPTAYNRDEIVKLDALGDYLIPRTAAVGSIAGSPSILSDSISTVGIVPGSESNLPPRSGLQADHVVGLSDATVSYSVVDRSSTTNDEYRISFIKDSSSSDYKLFYNITDFTTGGLVIDSLDAYNYDGVNNLVDGVSLNVGWISPQLKGLEFEDGLGEYFSADTVADKVGPFYVGSDYTDDNGKPKLVTARGSAITTLEKMRRVELRFGVSSKAYRYVKKPIRFVYVGDSSDAFVDVPFQAWIKDDKYGEEEQLAVGFLEDAFPGDSLANPDGVWDPGTDVTKTLEYIVIFDTPYDPNGGNIVYTGVSPRWSDLGNGYNLNDPSATDEDKTIARSPWFDALYVVGLNRTSNSTPFNPKGTLVIEPDSYPLTTADTYRYQVSSELTTDQKKTQFDKINVFPNPLFAYNAGVSYTGGSADEPYVTFSNLPDEVTVKIFTLSGNLIRTLSKNSTDPTLRWDLQNESGLRVASGMYLAIVSNPQFGDKVLKFAIIMPQKQILKY